MATNGSSRSGLIWALVGGVVVLSGIVAIIVSAALPRTPDPSASRTPSPGSTQGATPPEADPSQAYVDDSVSTRGWVPEPITTDPDTYIRAALSAASTFDTTKATREEWLSYLDTWFTPDTRYTTQQDRGTQLAAAKLELRQGVVLPESEWDSLAGEDGHVVGAETSEISSTAVPDDSTGDMRIGTADVTLTFSRSGEGGETSYEETVRVSVQVLCGPGSVPVADSAQQPGDCKVVRYFTEPLEP